MTDLKTQAELDKIKKEKRGNVRETAKALSERGVTYGDQPQQGESSGTHVREEVTKIEEEEQQHAKEEVVHHSPASTAATPETPTEQTQSSHLREAHFKRSTGQTGRRPPTQRQKHVAQEQSPAATAATHDEVITPAKTEADKSPEETVAVTPTTAELNQTVAQPTPPETPLVAELIEITKLKRGVINSKDAIKAEIQKRNDELSNLWLNGMDSSAENLNARHTFLSGDINEISLAQLASQNPENPENQDIKLLQQRLITFQKGIKLAGLVDNLLKQLPADPQELREYIEFSTVDLFSKGIDNFHSNYRQFTTNIAHGIKSSSAYYTPQAWHDIADVLISFINGLKEIAKTIGIDTGPRYGLFSEQKQKNDPLEALIQELQEVPDINLGAGAN